MINYDKWKLLNENFLVSQPLGGIRSNNGFLAYSPLSEGEDYSDEEDMDDDNVVRHPEEDMEDQSDEDEEDDIEGDIDDMEGDIDDMEGDIDDMEDDEEDMEDDEEDMEDDEDDEDEDDEDEIDQYPYANDKHHHHHHHHHHDSSEFDDAVDAVEKMSAEKHESLGYKMPSINEWTKSVQSMMFPDAIQKYIPQKTLALKEAADDSSEKSDTMEEWPTAFQNLKRAIEKLDQTSITKTKKDIFTIIKICIDKLLQHSSSDATGRLNTTLTNFRKELDKLNKEATPAEGMETTSSMKKMKMMSSDHKGRKKKHAKKSWSGMKMKMMPKMSGDKMGACKCGKCSKCGKMMGHASKNMKKSRGM